jgi:hypothetical protein
MGMEDGNRRGEWDDGNVLLSTRYSHTHHALDFSHEEM